MIRLEDVPGMIDVLTRCRDELEDLRDGEICEHEVNICWCNHLDLIDAIDAIMVKWRGEDVRNRD